MGARCRSPAPGPFRCRNRLALATATRYERSLAPKTRLPPDQQARKIAYSGGPVSGTAHGTERAVGMSRLQELVGQAPKRGWTLPSWLERILSVGIVSKDADVIRRQRCVNVACFAVSGDTVTHLITNSLHDFHGLLPVIIYCAVMTVLPLLVPMLHRFGELASGVALSLLILFAHMFVVWSFGTSSDVHMYYTIVAGATIFFFGVQHWRVFLLFLALYIGALLIAINFAPFEGWVIPGVPAVPQKSA